MKKENEQIKKELLSQVSNSQKEIINLNAEIKILNGEINRLNEKINHLNENKKENIKLMHQKSTLIKLESKIK